VIYQTYFSTAKVRIFIDMAKFIADYFAEIFAIGLPFSS